MRPGRVRYSNSQGYDIAWQEFGDGPGELLLIWGAPNHLDTLWEWPSVATFLRRLAVLGRVVQYDVRGTGLSSRVSIDELPAVAERALDALGVMDAADLSRPVVVAETSSAPIGVELAVRHADRLSGLVLLCPAFKGLLHDELVPVVLDVIDHSWGEPVLVETLFPNLAGDPRYVDWFARHLRLSASPAAARALLEMDQQTDVTALLPDVAVPTLILGRRGDDLLPPELLRDQAALVPDHTLVITSGEGHVYGAGPGDDEAVGAIASFLGRPGGVMPEPDLVDRAILFTDIVGSTDLLSTVGDRRWRQLMDDHDRAMSEVVAGAGGELIKGTGDGVLALFDDPDRAVEAVALAVERLGAIGIDIRSGIHCGPVELRGDDVSGIAVHTASRVADRADAGELLVTAVASEALSSRWSVTSLGDHDLKGLSEPQELFAVTIAAPSA